MSAEFNELVSSLTRLSDTLCNGISVSVTLSDVVKQLQSELDEQSAKYDALQQDFNRLQFKFRCECLINHQLTDYVQDLGIEVPKRLFDTSLSEE